MQRERHGMTRTRIYRIWQNMRARCYRKANHNYHSYGGRGIIVCEKWKNSFSAFYADVGLPTSNNHSLNRTDNDGPYSPENCTWVTQQEQMNNTRVSHYLEYRGKKLTISQWARKLNIGRAVIQQRLKHGWSVTETLSRKVDKMGTVPKQHSYDGRSLTLRQWAKEIGVHTDTLQSRLKRGYTIEQALLKPKKQHLTSFVNSTRSPP